MLKFREAYHACGHNWQKRLTQKVSELAAGSHTPARVAYIEAEIAECERKVSEYTRRAEESN